MTYNSGEHSETVIDRVVVVGLGSIGLPLALLLAKHEIEVVGVDIKEHRLEKIENGTLKTEEDVIGDLLQNPTVQKNLTTEMSPVPADVFVICVPTPLQSPSLTPDISQLKGALKSVVPHLEKGNLVNVESTVPPMTIDTIVTEQLTTSGITPGENLQVAYSPERLFPGNVFPEIIENDRIIGGITEASAQRARELYETFHEGQIYVTDPISAEMAKVMENTFRDVNVALANEFAMIGGELNVDVFEIINLANNHPRVDILKPGIGVGGHCLPIDPWFLNHINPENTNLVTTARRINDEMPKKASRIIRQEVSEYTDPKILALGAAYKPNTKDTRNSPAIKVVSELQRDGYDITHYDRHVEGLQYSTVRSLLTDERPDIIVQLVPHDETVNEIKEANDVLTKMGVKSIKFGQDSFVSTNKFTPKE